jgi:hypothetical protein
MDAFATALSGVRAAELRLACSAHNVANLLTDPEHLGPVRVVQRAEAGGGVTAVVEQASAPRPIELSAEVVEQIRASLQLRASLRAPEAEAALRLPPAP